MQGITHILECWGELACFTRPELKVERYSYPVITPSAARGIFDAIYWKPDAGFYWQIERIEVLSPPRYIPLRRNEVKNKAPATTTVLGWRDGRKPPEPLWADGDSASLGTDQKGRTQRQTMALKDVRYRLHAHMRLRRPGNPKPLDAQFERRATGGKCIYQPYFGCREFPAYFEPAGEDRPPPLALDMELGWMVYDIFDLSRDNSAETSPSLSLFKATMQQGVIEVPAYEDERVLKGREVDRA